MHRALLALPDLEAVVAGVPDVLVLRLEDAEHALPFAVDRIRDASQRGGRCDGHFEHEVGLHESANATRRSGLIIRARSQGDASYARLALVGMRDGSDRASPSCGPACSVFGLSRPSRPLDS